MKECPGCNKVPTIMHVQVGKPEFESCQHINKSASMLAICECGTWSCYGSLIVEKLPEVK